MRIPTLRSKMFAKHCATRLRPSASGNFPSLVVLEALVDNAFVTFDRGGFAIRRPQRDSYPRLQHAEDDRI